MLIKINSKLIKLKFDHCGRWGCARWNASGEPRGAARRVQGSGSRARGARGPRAGGPGRPRRRGPGCRARGGQDDSTAGGRGGRAVGARRPCRQRAGTATRMGGPRRQGREHRGEEGGTRAGKRERGKGGRERERERGGGELTLGIQNPAITVTGSPRARGGREVGERERERRFLRGKNQMREIERRGAHAWGRQGH
jgi:hypothetical protein